MIMLWNLEKMHLRSFFVDHFSGKLSVWVYVLYGRSGLTLVVGYGQLPHENATCLVESLLYFLVRQRLSSDIITYLIISIWFLLTTVNYFLGRFTLVNSLCHLSIVWSYCKSQYCLFSPILLFSWLWIESC